MTKYSIKDIQLTLGNTYRVGWRSDLLVECKLIQPTKKGFNFLDLETNKCILNNHLYSKGFMIKPLPKKTKTFNFNIWSNRLIIKNVI